MKGRAIFFIFDLFVLLLCCSSVDLTHAQSGCSLIDKTRPAQYIAYEGLEEGSSSKKGDGKERIVLRLRNNTSCDITIWSLEGNPQTLVLDKLSDGEIRLRIASAQFPSEFPDGARLGSLKYEIEYLEPLPPPKKRIYIDELRYDFSLIAGRSVLFSIPLSHFDRRINIEVPFEYDWDKAMYQPSHEVTFSNYDLPEELFRRTKVCQKTYGCKSRQSNHRRHLLSKLSRKN